MLKSSSLTLGVLVFNQAPFIEKLLKSISDQNDNNWQLLIVDNASTDNSKLEITNCIEKYGLDQRARVFFNPINTGSAAGLNQLVREAATKYLAVIHGDDEITEDFVKVANESILNSQGVQAFNSILLAFPNDSNTNLSKRIYKSIWTNSDRLNRFLVCGLNPGVMPGSILDCEFIKRGNFLEFPQLINGVEDTLLWMRIIRAGGKIRSQTSPTYRYRIHKNQFSFEDKRNSLYFGLARKMIITESNSSFERLLAKSEVSYELTRFGKESAYLDGLGTSLASDCIKWRGFRIFNIIIRRMAIYLSR
jgi:glycosyltransferase involved in cell wall biosynthesis